MKQFGDFSKWCLICFVLSSLTTLTCSWEVRDLGFFFIRNPAFTAIEPRPGGIGGFDLSISTFSAIPDSLDSNYIVRDVAQQLVDEGDVRGLEVEELKGGLFWPNEVLLVPG